MRPIKLAYRYAKALFELAGEQDIREQVYGDMQLFTKISSENRGLRVMLQSPVIRHDKKNAVLREVFGAHFHPTTLAYTTIITRKRREMILTEIASQYIVLYKEWKGIKTALFRGAVEIDDKQRSKIIDLLSKQLNAQIELQVAVQPELLGGFILSVEDKQLDASILKKVKKLTKEFNVNIYEKKF